MEHVTVIPIMLILSFFQCKTVFSTSLANGQPDLVDEIGLHNVLWIIKNESSVILFWNNNLTKEETDKYTVKYILSYKFFNTTHERKERLQEKQKIIHLDLHSGFNAKVKTQLFAKESEDVIKEGDWTELSYKAPPVYIQNLSCIIYNISSFNCTWHIKAEAPEDIQVFFTCRHVRKDFECQQYIQNARKKNVGCHMKEIYFQALRKIYLNITVRNLRNNSGGLSYYKAFPPQTIEKLDPPINVSVSLENRSIKIHWKPPPTIGSARRKCFLYQVKITDRKIVNVTAETYEYPFHKPAKKCSAQVRVKKEVCVRNKIWSEWSEPVFIHDEKTSDVMLLSLMVFGVLIFFGGLIYACRRYSCLEVITMPVPCPSDNIQTWLAADDIHHQKEMSMQMQVHLEIPLGITLGITKEDGDENIQQQGRLKESGLEDLKAALPSNISSLPPVLTSLMPIEIIGEKMNRIR